jgi:hypothetical protein
MVNLSYWWGCSGKNTNHQQQQRQHESLTVESWPYWLSHAVHGRSQSNAGLGVVQLVSLTQSIY